MKQILHTLFFLFVLVFSNSINAFGNNPFLASSDATTSCAIDGSTLPEFYLCNLGQSRTVEINDPDVLNIQWQKLDELSCAASSAGCPNLNGSCQWNTVSTNNSFVINSAGEYRVLMSYASSSTSEMFYAKVYLEDSINTVFVTQEVSVNGARDGAIEVNTTGGSGVYLYQVLDFNYQPISQIQPSSVFSGLLSGDYIIKIINNFGCENFTQFTINQPSILEGNSILTQGIACIYNGEITVSASGGVPPYMYSINGGLYQNSNVFLNLTPGFYVVDVRDSKGAITRTNGVTLTVSEALFSNATVKNISCNGAKDGQISMEAFGGSGVYQYQLSNGADILVPYQNSNVFNNLQSGTYDFSVQDSAGCSSMATVIVTEPSNLEASVTITSITGYQENNGVITVTAEGGSQDYLYAISPNLSSFSNTNIFSGLTPGDFTILVKDTNGCFVSMNAVITEPLPVESVVTVTSPYTCTSTAAIEILVSGGVGSYEYSLDGGNSYILMSASKEIVSNFMPGTYTIFVRDANYNVYVNTITIDNIEPLAVNFTTENISCNGAVDGSINLVVAGGIDPYIFKLKDTNGNEIRPDQTSNIFENLNNGQYIVEIFDAGDCVLTSPIIEIIDVQQLTMDIVSLENGTYYGADNGSVIFNVSGGNSPYTYSINSGQYIPFVNEQSINGLMAGNNNIAIKDANGCEVNDSFLITEPDELVVLVNVSGISCSNNTNAQVEVIATGGSGNFMFAYNSAKVEDAQVENSFTGIPLGSYFISVFDANGYFKTVDFVVAESQGLSLDTEIVYDFTTNDSAVKISVVGGEPPYQFSNDDVLYKSFPLFGGLANGEHSFFVIDKNNCKQSISVIIDFNDSDYDGVLDRDEDVNANENLDDDDTDGDGIPDYKDTDDDGDGVSTSNEIEKNLIQDTIYLDTDNDNIPNYLDNDDDGDGYLTLDEDYNNNGNPVDDDINKSGIADYLEKGINPESVTDLDIKKEVVVFQNAGHTESINVLWKSIQKSQTLIKVYNGKGNIVYSSNLRNGTYETKLNVSQLSRGVYFIYIKNDDMEEIKKVLIQ